MKETGMSRTLRRLAASATTLAVAGAAAWTALRPRALVWGATEEEIGRAFPGDDLVADPLYVTTRAITVRAPAETVWPWIVQLGQNRGGFYTYDVLENLFHLDIHSADRINPEWQDLTAGEDYVALDPDEEMKMTIAVLEPPHAFVLRSGAPGQAPQPPGDFFKGELAFAWGFIVEPRDAETSRLIVRTRASWYDTAAARVARPLLLEPAHFVMEEGMLRGIRDRAERPAG
jgi:hypothetical protein